MALGKVRTLFALIVMVYVISPVVFKYSPFIQHSLLFMNHFNTKFNLNLSRPEDLHIKCTRTLRLTNDIDVAQDKRIELGVWHIVPESSLHSCTTLHDLNRTSIDDELAFADSRPIVLYIHGNGGNRGGSHRARLYLRLAKQHDYHIVTFDYRGYGDSTYVRPTADGLSSDANFMYRWLLRQKNVAKERIIVWGHSLGTAVAVRMVADLPLDLKPSKLILEAPFDSIANAIANHPFSTPFRIIPYFEYFFIEPIEKSPEFNFDSASRIGDVKPTPVMIMHADDDAIIPSKLGHNLYKRAMKQLGQSKVKFISIEANQGLGHKHICNHDETMLKVKQFVEN